MGCICCRNMSAHRAGHHARRIRRRPLPLRGRGRYQRRLRALPGGRLRRRRRQLPGRRGAARENSPSSTAFPDALRVRLERFLTATGVEVAGIEFITGADGRTLVYDVNTNTNYNPDAEARAGRTGTARSGPERSPNSWAANSTACALRPDCHRAASMPRRVNGDGSAYPRPASAGSRARPPGPWRRMGVAFSAARGDFP